MKKLFLTIFIVLLSVLCITGCEKGSIEESEKAFEEFLNAKNIQLDMLMRVEKDEDIVQSKLLSFAVNGQDIKLDLTQYDMSFVYIDFSKNLYYENREKGNERCYVDNVRDFVDVIKEESKDAKTIDIKNYLTEITYQKTSVEFNFDVAKILVKLGGMGIVNVGSQKVDPIKVTATVDDGKITEVNMDLAPTIKKIVGEDAPSVYTITAKNIDYKNVEIKIPTVTTSIPNLGTDIGIFDIIISDLDKVTNGNSGGNSNTGGNTGNNNVQPNYSLSLYRYDYYVAKGKEIDINGVIYNNSDTVAYLKDCNYTVTPQIDLQRAGKTDHTISLEVDGTVLSSKITITVIEEQKANENFTIGVDSIYNVFDMGEYLLIASKDKLYKYDTSSKQVVANVSLIYTANSIYTKGEYLFVAANDIKQKAYLENDAYRGTVSKIKIEDFSLVNQVTVNCCPYSIFVDNRDSVIVGKGYDQHIEYSEVDMSTGELKNVLSGYQKDYLIYDEQKDAFLSVTQNISSSNEWYFYGDNAYNSAGKKSTLAIEKISYVSDNGKTIISVTGAKSFVYAVYNQAKQDYESKEYTQSTLPEFNYTDNVKFIDIEGDEVYRVLSYAGNRTMGCIMVYNTVNDEQEYKLIELEDKMLTNMFVVDGVVYVNYDNDNKLYAYEIN